MKVLIGIFFLLLPVAVLAQGPQSMGGMDIQKMMQQAQEIQACMQNVDQDELQKFQNRSMEVNSEIKSLCAAGKRKKAQKLAIKFGKEASKNPAMQEMKKCGEMAEGMMSQMPQMDQGGQMDQDVDYSKQHVCDNLE